MSAGWLSGINRLLFVCGHVIDLFARIILYACVVRHRIIHHLAEFEYSDYLRLVPAGTLQPCNCDPLWESLFDVAFTMPPLCKSDGSGLYDPVERKSFVLHLRANIDVDFTWPQTSFHKTRVSSDPFWSFEVERLLNSLDSYGCPDPIDFFLIMNEILTPKLSVIFRTLRCCSLPAAHCKRGFYP